MKKSTPRIFVSSTCYDLNQIRCNIKQFIDNMGYQAILSEYSSFPISPDKNTLDNCIDAIKSNASIFILIIGGRYGSVVDNNKSITNIEFETALIHKIPTYVFINNDILPVS